MFVRVLFLLLVALNLGAGAWLLFGHEPGRTPPPATDPGVPELRLVAEARRAAPAPPAAQRARVAPPTTSALVAAAPSSLVPAAGASTLRPPLPASMLSAATQASRPATAASVPVVAPPPATTAPGVAAAETCMRLGPFATAAAQQAAIARLSPHVARIRGAEQPATRSRGFLVYLPAAASHAAALEETHVLAAKGVRDYFVIGSGDMQDAVSLGVYDSPANAQKRADDLGKLGFTAKVKERIDSQPAYWADYAVPAAAGFEWQAALPGQRGLQAKPIACF